MPSTGQPDAAVRGTQNSPLPPSVETAYYRKCIELKRRVNEIEESNDAARVRKIRVNRQILKMRLERAFLLENLQRRMDANFDDSDRSTSPPPTPQEKPLRSKRGHRKTTPPPPGASVTNLETPGSTTMAASGPPGQSYFDAAPDTQPSLAPPRLTPGQSQPSASPYPPIQPQPAQSSPSAPPSTTFANGQTHGGEPGEKPSGARHDGSEEDRRTAPVPDRDGEARANGQTLPSASADKQGGNTAAAQDAAPTEGGTGGGFTALNR